MKRYGLIALMIFLLPFAKNAGQAFGQNVGINSTGAPANASALLDLDASDKGFLMPRLSITQRNNITSPATGLQILDTTTNCIEIFYGHVWQTASCFCNGAPAIPGTITGATTACVGQSQTYSIAAVSGATSYNWTLPSGAAITSGLGTNSVTVAFAGASGSVGVSAVNNCGSSSANSVTVTVSSPTITGTTPASVCDAGTAVLGATASAGTINWYAASTGGTSLYTGTSFTAPSISATTNYYADATSGGCTSTSRTAVTATVNASPTITGTTPGSRTGPGTVNLGATSSAGTINWYAASTGGSSLATGTSYTTPSISVTTTYYVDAANNGCTTPARTGVTASILSPPIAFDANSYGTGANTSAASFSHTCSGSNRILFVVCSNQGGGVGTVQYNGTTMTEIQSRQGYGTNRNVQLFYLVNPDSGTHTITIGGGPGYWTEGVGVSYTGVKQTSPINASAAGTGNSGSFNASVTTTTDKCWTIVGTNFFQGDATAGTNATLVRDPMDNGYPKAFDNSGHGAITPAGSFSMGFTGTSGTYAWIMAAFAPAP